MRRRSASSQTAATPSDVTITLKSLRNPPISLTLPSQSLTTSIVDLKSAISKEVKAKSIDGIKILYNKKPCADSKTVKDVLGEEEVPSEIEFGVMIMVGVLPEKGPEGEKGVDGKEGAGKDPVNVELESEEFWADLKGFLSQRLKDDGKAEEVANTFRLSWKAKAGAGGGWKWGGIGVKGWSK